MASKPTHPTWATDGGTTVEPSAVQKAAGFVVATRPPARWFNWLLNKIAAWLSFLLENSGQNGYAVAAMAVRNLDTAAHATNITFYDVCWSAELGIFCACGYEEQNEEFGTSPDGLTWTKRGTLGSVEYVYWRRIVWSPELGLFVAVADNQGTTHFAASSPDGVTWTARTLADKEWLGLCWSPELGLFCAVGTDGNLALSSNGTAWTLYEEYIDKGGPLGLTSVCWSPELGLFCALSANYVAVSANGTSWSYYSSAENNSWVDVCWSPELGLFCAVSYTGTHRVMTSPDGVNWTARSASSVEKWHRIAWCSGWGVFAAIGADATSGKALMISPDGENWTAFACDDNATDYGGICWSQERGQLCIAGNINAVVSF